MGKLNQKNILLLSSGDANGAYEYVYKLAELFIGMGHHVKMLVKHRTKSKDFIIQYRYPHLKNSLTDRIISKIKQKINPSPKPIFETHGAYCFISKDETSVNIDVQSALHQIGFTPDYIFSGMTDGFMNSTDLLNLQKLTKAKVYNITVDMNHFTGGCHFAWDCMGYIEGCGDNCPAIKKGNKNTAKINFDVKLKNAKQGDFQIFTGSGWTVKQAQESKIYGKQKKIYNINSLIDTKILNDKNRSVAKQIFGLHDNTFYILTGCQYAHDPRKGFDYLTDALKIFSKHINNRKVELLLVSRTINHHFDEIAIPKKHLEYINDYRLLSLLYQASDVFVNSSVEDSGPMMVSEALACGTPVVGFDMGVLHNMVATGYNGYKAELKNAKDLAKGIEIIYNLSDSEYAQFSKNAVKQVESYSSYEYAEKILNEVIV